MPNEKKLNKLYFYIVEDIKFDKYRFFWTWHHSTIRKRKQMLQSLATKFERKRIPKKKISTILAKFLFQRKLMSRVTARRAVPTKYKNKSFARNV